jgi:anti-sigma B factor antagonist
VILSNRHEGKTAIVEIKGRLTLSPELRELKPRIDTVLDSKPSTSLVLNLSGVSDVDSSGLGELVAIHTSATRRGVRIALAEVHPRIKELFAITRLDGIFAVCSDLRSALQHVAQSQVADQSQ